MPIGSSADTIAAKEVGAFIASIFNGFPGARAEAEPPGPSPTRSGFNRPDIDSWENYMERHVIWIDAGPSPAPTHGDVVKWFSFAPPTSQGTLRSPIHSSDYVAISPSHVSNSIESSGYDTPSSVPSTVPEGPSDSAGGSSEDGIVESGRATKRKGNAVWRLLDGSWHPRNIYNVSDDPRDIDALDSADSARRT